MLPLLQSHCEDCIPSWRLANAETSRSQKSTDGRKGEGSQQTRARAHSPAMCEWRVREASFVTAHSWLCSFTVCATLYPSCLSLIRHIYTPWIISAMSNIRVLLPPVSTGRFYPERRLCRHDPPPKPAHTTSGTVNGGDRLSDST